MKGGLDVKNGIILIEYIGQLRKEGQTLDEALIHAGRRRFRPILMTSLCTIFGLAPLALGLGPGAQMQQALAIAVIGGLIANMLLIRLLIPVGYLVLQRKPALLPVRIIPDFIPARSASEGRQTVYHRLRFGLVFHIRLQGFTSRPLVAALHLNIYHPALFIFSRLERRRLRAVLCRRFSQ